MAPKNTFSLKFTSEGLQDVLKSSEKVRLSYEEWIESAEKSIQEANRLSEEYADNQEKLAEAEALKAKAAKTATRTIANSYRELGVKSSKSVEDQKQRAISAFNAIKKSGVASAEDIARAEKALEKRLEQLDAQLDDTTAGMKDLDKSSRNAGDGFTVLKGAIASVLGGLVLQGLNAIGSGLINIGRSAIATREEMSRLRDQITLIEGSEVAGETAFNRISEFAKTTPFELNEVTQAYVKLGNRGIKPTNEQLIKLGDLALSQNKSLDQLVEAVLDAQTGENERLKEFGIRASKSGDQVTFAFKGVEKQVALTEDAVLDALVSFGEAEGVAGSIEKAGNRLDGVGSNIADTFTRLYDTIGGIFEPLLVQGGKFLVQVLEPISDPAIWEPLTQAFQSAVEAVSGIAPDVQSIQSLVSSSLQTAIQAIANIIEVVSVLIAENRDRFIEIGATLQGTITQSFGALLSQAAGFTEQLRDNPKLINEMAQQLGSLLTDLQQVLASMAQLAQFISSIIIGIANANNATGGWFAKIVLVGAAIAKIIGVIGAVIGGIAKISAAVGGVTAIVGSVAAAWTSVVGAVTAVIAVIGGVAAAIGGVIAGILSIPVIVAGVIAAAIVAAGVAIYTFRDEIIAAFTAAWNVIASAFTSAWNGMVNTATSIWQNYVADVTRGWNATVQVIEATWETLVRFFAEGWQRFNDAAAEALGFADKAINALISPMRSIFDIGKGIGKSITDWANPLKKASDLLNKFKNGFVKILGLSEEVGTDVGQNLESRTSDTGGPLLPAPSGSFHPSSFPITSPFGMRNGRLHAGTDYGTPQGTPLSNIFGAGVVTMAGQVGAYGGLIELTLTNGDIYRFGHMSQIMVREGQLVPPGALMGLTGGAVGTPGAGRSTGPHLHLEYYPGGGGPVPFTALPGRGGPENNIIRFPGKGGPKGKTSTPAKKKQVGLADTKIQALIEETVKVITRVSTDFTELEQLENQIKDKFDRAIAKIDEAEEKIKASLELKKAEKLAYDEESKSLEKLTELREEANAAREKELTQSAELFKLRQEAQSALDKVTRDNELLGINQEIDSIRLQSLESRGRITPFEADRARIQSQIVQTQADFAQRFADLGLQETTAETPEQVEHVRDLIEAYRQLEQVRLDELRKQIEDVNEAQKEANRILPSTVEIAQVGFDGLKGFLGSIGDVITGAKDLGETLKSAIAGIINNLGQLFANRAFKALENVLFPGSSNGVGSGLGSLIQTGIGSLFGGGGGAEASALNFDSAPIFAASGGLVLGPGTSRSDSINARLSNHEYVIQADSVRAVGVPALDFINESGSIPNQSTNVVNISVQAEDAGSFRKTERQINSTMLAELQKFR